MNVCLVAAPTAADLGVLSGPRSARNLALAQYPPLGILTLAATLGRHGIAHTVIDLNSLFYGHPEDECGSAAQDLFDQAVCELRKSAGLLVGFSTLSNTYPVTIRLARALKHSCPDRIIVFGGPQASAVDVETLKAFPFVDLVVRGEAERILPHVIEECAHPDRLTFVEGLTFRRGGEIVRTPDPVISLELDRLPTPAYHLWPPLKDLKSVPIEVGRGCPFSCSFCSTSRFFRRRFRLKTPARILQEMRAIRAEYGIARFGLMHDCFTVDRGRAIAFCNALLESGERFEWTCSSRTDCLDEDLLKLMAQSGCLGIFLGIETGSGRIQREIKKNLDLDHAIAVIRSADGFGLKTDVSMIAGFPNETRGDVQSTVDFLLDAARSVQTEPQFHLLAPLAGTEICERYRDSLIWDGAYSDMACQSWRQEEGDRSLVLSHPKVFPNFYAVPTPHLSRPYVVELRAFLLYALGRFRWLLVALHDLNGTILNVFDKWLEWCSAQAPAVRDRRYYSETAFRQDFLTFVRGHCLNGGPGATALEALLDYEDAVGKEREPAPATSGADARQLIPDLESVPFKAAGVTIISLQANYGEILESLREKRSLKDISRRLTIVADRQRSETLAEVVELTQPAAHLLTLCDGSRTVRELAEIFPTLQPGLEHLPAEAACLYATAQLAEQGLVAFGNHVV